LAFALHSEMLRRGLFEADPKSALPLADEIVACGKQDGVQLYPAWARFYQGVVAAQDADPRPGIAVMRQVRQALHANKVGLFAPIHLYHLAAAHRRCGEHDIAFGLIEEGIRTIETTGERMFEAELYRLSGELQLEVGRVDSGEAALTTATAVAQRQQARLWELRAAVALAHHWGENGNTAAARDLLAPVYGWFSEGLDAPDLRRARSLLKRLD
jgi:predicted ATPase